MAMGWGCNAAGVVAARIIESPRERLIAIITNNFAICNGRWPTQILVASIFVGGAVPAHWAGLISALAVVGVAVLGVVLTFATSWLLSRTLLRGEVSAFSLELPPYRPPRDPGHALHLAHRPHALRAVACGGVRPAGRRGDLAGLEHPLRRHQPGRADRHVAAAVRRRARPVGGDSARLRRGDSRQRDRGADDPHADRAGHRRAGRRRRRRRDVRARLDHRHRGGAAAPAAGRCSPPCA